MQQLFEQIENQRKLKNFKKNNEEQKISENINKHEGVYCNICNCTPLIGSRYKCFQCEDFDIC